jgi:hypothetical protein
MNIAAADALMGIFGMKRVKTIGLRPMHIRPLAGSRLVVMMRDGRQIECLATMVTVLRGDKSGIVIYNGRNPIDETKATGWWPTPKAAR